MKIWGMSLGGFPRSRYARHTLRDCEKGVLSIGECNDRLIKVHSEIIGAQKAVGLPVVVDGMVDWHDIFRPFVRSWRNVSVDGLLRYFDNNFFYRIPIFTGEPDIIEPVWSPRIREYSDLIQPAQSKIVLPGPLSFASMAKNLSDLSREELAERIAYLLRREITTVFERSKVFIQIDEPILSGRKVEKDDARLAVELFNNIIDGYEDYAILAVYFDAPSASVYDELLEAKSKFISLDIIDTLDKSLNLINNKGFGDHVPVLGIIDGRRIYDDKISEKLIDSLKQACENCEELVITSSTWFDLIPYKYALKKVWLIAKAVEILARALDAEPYTLWTLKTQK